MIGRDTQGVKLMNVDEDTKVVSVALVYPDDDNGDEDSGNESSLIRSRPTGGIYFLW